MAAVQRKLVHKQFNSPMDLYSNENIRETVNRELKAVGSMGIELEEQHIPKPLNLANSAVLRALEEEEHEQQCGYKRVAWPPIVEDKIPREFTPQPQSQFQPQQYNQQTQQIPASAGANQYQAYRAPSAPVGYQQHHHHQQQQQHQQQPPPQYFGSHSLASQQPQQQQQQQSSSHPTLVDGVKQSQPVGYYQIPQQQQQYQQSPNQLLQQDYYQQPQYRQSEPPEKQYNYYSQPQEQTSSPQHQHQQQPQQLAGGHPQQQFRGESPGVITLRKEVPLTQQPSPVYSSQPATASYRGGSNMRGDLKWPPPEYKEQAAVDNDDRVKLAKGPVCRPRRIKKDYTQFFAKNALNSYYPSYRVPPGTQHMIN